MENKSSFYFDKDPCNSAFRGSKEDCKTCPQWYCGAEFGSEPFVLFPNSVLQCHYRRVRQQSFYEHRKGEFPYYESSKFFSSDLNLLCRYTELHQQQQYFAKYFRPNHTAKNYLHKRTSRCECTDDRNVIS